MLCLCASPQLIPQALCRLDVAIGTIVRTYSLPKYAYSNTNIPPMEPPTTAATWRTPRSSRISLCMLPKCQYSNHSIRAQHVLDIVPYCGQREFRPISLLSRVSVFTCDWTCASVRAPKTVQTDDKEPRYVESSARPSHQWAPPVADVGTAGQGMTYNHSVVAIRGEPPPRTVCDRDIAEKDAGFESEGWDDCDLLIRYEGGKWVLGLCGCSLYGI